MPSLPPQKLPPSAQDGAEALRVKVASVVMLVTIAACLCFIVSYVVTRKFVLIPFMGMAFLLPAAFFYLRVRRNQDYRTIVWFLAYMFTMLGLFKLTTAPGYLVDLFLMPTYIGTSFLMLKYRHAVLMVGYLLLMYAGASAILYWFEPFPILYANDNASSIAISFNASIIAASVIFYVFSKNYQQNSEVLNDTLQALNKVNDDNRLLINVVSHDFRNYLMRVLLLIETHKSKTSDATRLQELDDLEDAIHQLSELISDVQVVRDLSGDKVTHNRTAVAFDEILKKIELVFRHQMLEKELVFNRDKVQPLKLTVNPDIFIHIILANLIGNAIKFSPPRTEIILGLEQRADIPVLTIANDAPAEHLDNLRKLVSGEEVASAPGTSLEMGQGLGIAIMRKFCHAYDIEYALSVALLPDARLCRVTSRLSFLPD